MLSKTEIGFGFCVCVCVCKWGCGGETVPAKCATLFCSVQILAFTNFLLVSTQFFDALSENLKQATVLLLKAVEYLETMILLSVHS